MIGEEKYRMSKQPAGYDFLCEEWDDLNRRSSDSPVFVLGKFCKRRHDLLREALDAENIGDLVERFEETDAYITVRVGQELYEDWQDEFTRVLAAKELTQTEEARWEWCWKEISEWEGGGRSVSSFTYFSRSSTSLERASWRVVQGHVRSLLSPCCHQRYPVSKKRSLGAASTH